MVETILNNTTPYVKIRASHEGSLHSSTLIALSPYLNLNVKKSWHKIDIQRFIVKHLISVDVFDESSLSSYCVASEFDVKNKRLMLS